MKTARIHTVEYNKCSMIVLIWQTSLSDSSKALDYRIFKTKFEFKEYFKILNIGDAIKLCWFRTTNQNLPIETGRWRNIDRGNRYCNLCNCQKLGDEYHYVLECSSLPRRWIQPNPTFYFTFHEIDSFTSRFLCVKLS